MSEHKKMLLIRSKVKQQLHLMARLRRLDEKLLELFTVSTSVKRYIAIQHLMTSYKVELNNLNHSIQAILQNLVKKELENEFADPDTNVKL